MGIYEASAPQFKKILLALDKWLDKGVELAQKKTFDPEVLLTARLAPDQFHLLRQIQAACDTAKSACARLTGREPPSHPDNERTVADVKKRIAAVIQYLDTFTPQDFATSESRPIKLPFFPGKIIVGRDYLNEYALPNFYFHATFAYAILRHNGVELGKQDFLASLTLVDA
jgi:hypothetical protein